MKARPATVFTLSVYHIILLLTLLYGLFLLIFWDGLLSLTS